MQLKEAKIRFESGCFKSAVITEAIMSSSGYNVELQGKLVRDSAVLSSQRADTEAKLFKSADAAIRAIKEIGFREITIKMSQSK